MAVAFFDVESPVKRIHVGYYAVHAVVRRRTGITLYAKLDGHCNHASSHNVIARCRQQRLVGWRSANAAVQGHEPPEAAVHRIEVCLICI